MGWKTSIIIASQTKQPNLAHDVRHDADVADRIAAGLPVDFASTDNRPVVTPLGENE